MIDANTPVLVGAGQYVERIDAPDYIGLGPVDLAARAARRACDDALEAITLQESIDAVAATRTFDDSTPLPPPFGTSNNFPRSIAKRLGISPRLAVWEKAGGNSPQYLVYDFCERIAAGEVQMALLAGAEAISTVRHLLARGESRDFKESIEGSVEDHGKGLRGLMKRYFEIYGLRGAPPGYALFENARRHRLGLDRKSYAAEMGRLFSPFSRIAAENPYSSAAVTAHSPTELVEVNDRNRMIADPYPLRLVSRDQVNQAAALVLTSVGKARALGIAENKWIFLHGYCELVERDILGRTDIGASLAAQWAAQSALASAEVSVGDVQFFDFYSCFPIAVFNAACDGLGLAADDPRGLTVTGGLPYFGGPGNNYSMHAIATMVEKLRGRSGTYGFIGANGGLLSKYAAGVYSTIPTPWKTCDCADLQMRVDTQKAPPVAYEADGDGTVETYTIVYQKGQPASGVVIGRLERTGERFIARTADNDRTTLEQMVATEVLDSSVRVCSTAQGNRFAFSKAVLQQAIPRKRSVFRQSYDYCLVDRRDHVLEVTINRPEVKNCLTPIANDELAEIFDIFLETEDLWIAILTGAGTEAFCTGNDLKYSASGKPMWVPKTGFAGLTARRGRTKPIIAAVNGFALGGGMEICLACDLIVVDESAQLGLPEVRVGLIAGAGGLVRLPRQIPKRLAAELLLTGKRISAERALELGLANRIAPAGKALDGARALAEELLECSPSSIQLSMRVLNESAEFPSEMDAARAHYDAIDDLLVSEDMHEGISAFLQKRKPRWKGR